MFALTNVGAGTHRPASLYRRRVAQRVQIAIDCHDPDRLATFWSLVLGYQLAPPPNGYKSWQEHADAQAEEPGESTAEPPSKPVLEAIGLIS
jgi:hypothetical protein